MNEAVIKKAQELAQLIKKSDEFIGMRVTEDAATKDEQLTAAFMEYEEKHTELERISLKDPPDFDKMSELNREMEEIQARFQSYPMAKALQVARQQFTDMMDAVNNELKKVLAPESAGGCSGHCDSCGGGCHHA